MTCDYFKEYRSTPMVEGSKTTKIFSQVSFITGLSYKPRSSYIPILNTDY